MPAQYQKASEHLGLSYVTERILASVLPRRSKNAADSENRPQSDGSHAHPDIYEKELLLMLEQKHGQVRKE